MFEPDVHYLRDKSVLQITLFYFWLSTSDGPRKVPQASPVSSNYSPVPGTFSQINLLDHFLLLRQTEIPGHDPAPLPGTWAEGACWALGKSAERQQGNLPWRWWGAQRSHGCSSMFLGCQSGSGWGSRRTSWLPTASIAVTSNWGAEAHLKRQLKYFCWNTAG